MSATRWLSASRGEDHVAERAEATVAWLTGQSSFRHSALSPGQLALLDEVAEQGFTAVRTGFPYSAAAAGRPYAKPSLVAASVRNAAQFLAARRRPAFAEDVARRLQPLLDRTSDRLLLICGSCGTELLTAAQPLLRHPAGLEVLVVALGPVGRLPDAGDGLRIRVVRGRGDWISRLGSTGAPDLTGAGGHLDYVRSPWVRDELRRAALEPSR